MQHHGERGLLMVTGHLDLRACWRMEKWRSWISHSVKWSFVCYHACHAFAMGSKVGGQAVGGSISRRVGVKVR